MNQEIKELEDYFDSEKDKHSSKDFSFGFIIGSVIVAVLVFILFILNERYNFAHENIIPVLLSLILFIVCLILILGSFKIKRDNIAYGIITSIFAFPVIIFIIWLLTYMVGQF